VQHFAWRSLVGEIPSNMGVRQLCHVKNCVNPSHLGLIHLHFPARTRRRVA
jgi:hypothetical protein